MEIQAPSSGLRFVPPRDIRYIEEPLYLRAAWPETEMILLKIYRAFHIILDFHKSLIVCQL